MRALDQRSIQLQSRAQSAPAPRPTFSAARRANRSHLRVRRRGPPAPLPSQAARSPHPLPHRRQRATVCVIKCRVQLAWTGITRRLPRPQNAESPSPRPLSAAYASARFDSLPGITRLETNRRFQLWNRFYRPVQFQQHRTQRFMPFRNRRRQLPRLRQTSPRQLEIAALLRGEPFMKRSICLLQRFCLDGARRLRGELQHVETISAKTQPAICDLDCDRIPLLLRRLGIVWMLQVHHHPEFAIRRRHLTRRLVRLPQQIVRDVIRRVHLGGMVKIVQRLRSAASALRTSRPAECRARSNSAPEAPPDSAPPGPGYTARCAHTRRPAGHRDPGSVDRSVRSASSS